MFSKYLSKKNNSPIILSAGVFIFTAALLSIVQLKLENPLILAERFIEGGGWIEIFFIALYGAWIAYKMSDPKKVPRWRLISWTVFSVVFFSQLLLGIVLSDKFLMTGKLHIPVPAMILAGPVYRGQISVMTILFLSTILLTGPAWCSQLCYFGAIDGLAARNPVNRGKLKNKFRIRHIALLAIIIVTLALRLSGLDPLVSTIAGISIGMGGIVFIILFSKKHGRMMHCILYCPIGTIVSYLKYMNPFRLEINMNCTFCGSCSSVCKYDAMSLADLGKKKPGKTCTLCGDCLTACDANSINYKLFRLGPELSRRIYLFLTISIHCVFLALARI